MFTLKSFIETIQGAVLNANDALMDKNMAILGRYFEAEVDDDELRDKLEDAIEASEDILDPETKLDREAVRNLLKKLRGFSTSLGSGSIQDLLTGGDLNPKTVALTFPTKGSDGTVEMKEVHVPLITLVPVQFSTVEELKLKADMELELVDEEVQVRLGKFSGQQKAKEISEKGEVVTNNSIGSIEITLKPQEASDGMQHIIDAYEKVLKAQLPH